MVFVAIRQILKPIPFTAAYRRDEERPAVQDLLECFQCHTRRDPRQSAAGRSDRVR